MPVQVPVIAKKHHSLRPVVFAVLAMFFWGMSFVWFKQVNTVYRPITIIFLRLLMSGSLLVLFIKITRRELKIRRHDVKWFLLLAFTQPFCYFMGESFGLSRVSSTISSVIIATIPLFTPVAAYLAYKEKVARATLAGILVSLTGIVIMLIRPDLSLSASPIGVGLLFVAVLSAVAYSLVIRKLAGNYQVFTIIAYQNLIGAVYFLPFFLLFDLKHFFAAPYSPSALFALLELAFFASTLSYLLYTVSIRDIGIIRANVFSNLIPVFTGVASYFVLSEQFTFGKILGMVLVMAGVAVSQMKLFR
ncbi:MAG TPA: DMT family transporter [Bacteroidales bacterium]|nr:DMT family transporter [Bacteroidales bacterium]